MRIVGKTLYESLKTAHNYKVRSMCKNLQKLSPITIKDFCLTNIKLFDIVCEESSVCLLSHGSSMCMCRKALYCHLYLPYTSGARFHDPLLHLLTICICLTSNPGGRGRPFTSAMYWITFSALANFFFSSSHLGDSGKNLNMSLWG